MADFKTIFKRFTNILLVLSILLRIYIHTYPSLTPELCSWDDKQQNHLSEKITDIFRIEKSPNFKTVAEKLNIKYLKTYLTDVYETMLNKKSAESKTSHNKYKNPRFLLFGDPQIKGNWKNTPILKKLDTFGNDYYLGHIFNTMFKRLKPDFSIVMGDLFSSQWISDDEFYNRTARYIKRVFPGAMPLNVERIEELKKNNPADDGINYKTDWVKFADKTIHAINNDKESLNFDMGDDVYRWTDKDSCMFINMTGNHDIGYSGDITYQHMSRFTDMFGKDNFVLHYNRGKPNSYRIVNLNSMLIEGPGLEEELVQTTWEFLYQLFEEKFEGTTVLLQHIPMYKPNGLCVDGPDTRFYPLDYEKETYKQGLMRSQNHLSMETTDKIMNLLFHNGKPGIILTGHDHYGCDVIYNRYSSKMKDNAQGLAISHWKASSKVDSKSNNKQFTGEVVQEITVRSMMGDFDGATGLLEMKFNHNYDSFDFVYKECVFAVQHVWWITMVTNILVILLISIRTLFF
ncbi:hypothetical protein D499_0A02860 [Hanseniaspora uvarum DSM 2768]|nr:hypothetical protein D499_0A02860 [Hanseniaspora uvarum DSM 2768]